ncbi:MAG TPA: hypothetical protein VIU11_18800 [Nakamurella sp.]
MNQNPNINGVLRLAADQLPRNHHGAPVAPLTPDGRPYRLRWVDHDHGDDLVYAETADDLLAHWIRGYQEADQLGRALLRSQHAVQIRDALVAQFAADASTQVLLTPEEEDVLLCDLGKMPDIARWDPPVPLVLLEGMYRPYTDRTPPISGIDGDVQEPSNIIWLRNAHPETYLASLAEAGVIDLAIHNP